MTGRVSVVRDDALGDDDLCGLLGRLERREVSPLELWTAACERAQRADAALHAVTSWADRPPDGATARGPFAGVPTLVKDNEELAGLPTTQGSLAVPAAPARASSPIVAHLLDLGLAPVAKTTLPEFGLTASTESTGFGATRNPWDTRRSVGGSSGGSAALVAAGVVPLAHANDGGGSIRIPAACCGLVGLKPSRGRLPDRAELDRLPVPLVVQGVLTRTVRDTARFFAESERLAPSTSLPPVGRVEGPGAARLRVGVLTDTIRGLPVSAASVTAVHRAAHLCDALGHGVEQIGPLATDRFGHDFLGYWALLSFLLHRGGDRLYGPGFDPSRLEPLTRRLSSMAVGAAPTLPGALRRLRRLAREGEDVFDRFDVILTPVTGHEAPPIGYLGPDVAVDEHLARLLRFTSFTPVQNVSGAPAVSLPLGQTDEGLPVGVQVVAARGGERRLLELAFELEQAAPWPTSVPVVGTG